MTSYDQDSVDPSTRTAYGVRGDYGIGPDVSKEQRENLPSDDWIRDVLDARK